jgi:tungstate transport system substrate-binding protein
LRFLPVLITIFAVLADPPLLTEENTVKLSCLFPAHVFTFLVAIVTIGCVTCSTAKAAGSNLILMASTIGPIDAGIVDALESTFEKETGIRVRHIGAGTGVALEIAKGGDVDLALVHAKALEEKFVKEGYGTERIDLMYNDFVIVGPEADPAGIKGLKDPLAALARIAEKKVLFVSRGDKSGTHVAEMGLWEKANIKPSGSWYQIYEKGADGNVPTLLYTDEQSAYTVIDRATIITTKSRIRLPILVENSPDLLNYISLIPVNPARFPRINHESAMLFIRWLTSAAGGQVIIRDFGKDQFGEPLFFPNSKEWRQATTK